MKSYLINLAGSTDRLAFMTEQFDRLGVQFDLIRAVDETSINSHPMRDRFGPPLARPLSLRERACTLSHYEAWRRLVESGDTCAAVFEDDVHIVSPIEQLLQLDRLPMRGRYVVRIETFNHPIRLFRPRPFGPVAGLKLARMADTSAGCGAYIISREAAAYFVNSPVIEARPIDDILFDFFAPNRRVPTFHFVPGLAIQDFRLAMNGGKTTFPSQINDRIDMKAAPPFTLWQRVRRRVKQKLIVPLFARKAEIVPFSASAPGGRP